MLVLSNWIIFKETSLSTNKLLKAYNQYERIKLTLAGCQKLETLDLVKFVSAYDLGSCISYSDIQVEELDERIKAEIEFYQQLKVSFKWHTLSTDAPSSLGENLIRQGFVAEESTALMVLDLDDVALNDTSELMEKPEDICVEVYDKEGIKDAISVQKKVWGGDCITQESHLLRLKEESPEQIRIYVIYQDDQPVSSAWLMCHPDSPFGSIWAGNTLAKYRGRGFYSALLSKRIQDAKTQGLKYLSIHASKMSQPIVAKYGFECIARSISYAYSHQA